MGLPRVLIVGQPFNNATGGGITLSNLFSGWDKDKIAVACFSYYFSVPVDNTICNNYYQLGYEDNKWFFPFNIIQNKHYSGPVSFDAPDKQEETAPPAKEASGFRKKLVVDYFFPFITYSGIGYALSTTKLSDKFKAWVKAFNPDVIYLQASSRHEVMFAIQLEAFLQKPVVYHVMDDWPSLISRKGLFKNYWRKKIDGELRQLLDKASLLLSISDGMSEEYLKRYGKKFIPFHNPIDLGFWKKYQRQQYDLGTPPVLLYAGRTGLGIQSSLKTIAKAVEIVNQQTGAGLQFVLQTAEAPGWISDFPHTRHSQFVPYEELPKAFASADLLILPYDFSDDSIRFIRFSMPTKAPEYMASGSPILVYSPPGTAILSYAEKHHCASLVTTEGATALAAALKDLVLDKVYRESLAANAKQAAEQYHDAANVREAFRHSLSSLVNSPEPEQKVIAHS